MGGDFTFTDRWRMAASKKPCELRSSSGHAAALLTGDRKKPRKFRGSVVFRLTSQVTVHVALTSIFFVGF
jgi:hypothetical protein